MTLVDNSEIRAIHAEAMRVRSQNRLPAQTLTESSCTIAQNWADHMARTGDFRHGNTGEHVIAYDSRTNVSAVSCIASWMGSSGHRAWILSPAPRLCGWGIARSSRGTYWAGRWEALNPNDPGDSDPSNPDPIPPPTPRPSRRKWWQSLLDWLRKR